MCLHAAICVLIPLYACVLILLYMCPHAESESECRGRGSIGSSGAGEEEDEEVGVSAYGSSGGGRGGRGHALGGGGKGGGSRAEALPIAAFRREIVERLKVHNVVIVVVTYVLKSMCPHMSLNRHRYSGCVPPPSSRAIDATEITLLLTRGCQWLFEAHALKEAV